jgi:hypothetical protein
MLCVHVVCSVCCVCIFVVCVVVCSVCCVCICVECSIIMYVHRRLRDACSQAERKADERYTTAPLNRVRL